MTSAPPDVAVVITTFNVRELLERCLNSLVDACASRTLEAVVVDNGVGDDTWPMLLARADVRAIRGSPELGFGGANNIGAAATSAPLILFLNPDTEPEPRSIEMLAGELTRRPDAAAAGPRLTLSDGSLDPAGRRHFPRPANAVYRFLGSPRVFRRSLARPYNAAEPAGAAVSEIEAVSGACLMVRREAFATVGGFDPRFFMYGDDLDLQRRLADAGWRTLYIPTVRVWHLKRQSSRQRPIRTRFEFYRSMWRYYSKHHGHDPWPLRVVVLGGVLILGCGGVSRSLAAWRPGEADGAK
ncbi:MAG: glycosyltransferase family 2 protein [Chloroflexi bacterium]|nr:glycosyltransferase family 2 protein [Chloroflexota bacterium]